MNPPAPPPTRFGLARTAAIQRATPTNHAPPPTRFAGGAPVLTKPAAPQTGLPRIVTPPPTVFSPRAGFAPQASASQPKHVETPIPTRHQPPPRTAAVRDPVAPASKAASPVPLQLKAGAPVPPPTAFGPRPGLGSSAGTLQPSRANGTTARQSLRPTLQGGVIQAARRVSYFNHWAAKKARKYRTSNDDVGGRNVATVHFTVLSTGATDTKTMASDGRHTEGLLFDWLQANHPGDYDVDWLYTELQTCGSDYHNCTARVGQWFPNATIYYSVDYPSVDDVSTDESDDGSNADATAERKRAKATRRRARGAPILRRFRTKARKRKREGDTSNVGTTDFRPRLVAPYSPAWTDNSLDPGLDT